MAFVFLALRFFAYFIIADALLSWVMPPDRFPRSFTTRVTDPLYRPIRRVLDPAKTGGFDLAPLVVLLAVQLLSSFLGRAAF